MGLFKSKPKISVEDCSRQFYDSSIFQAVIAGSDVWSGYLDTVFEAVVDADQSFSKIDPNVFWTEMTALRMELFALAWSHRFKKPQSTISQSLYTREYLKDVRKLKLWQIMGEYNRALAQSTVMEANGQPKDEWSVAKINKLRTDMFEEWADASIGDPSRMTNEHKEQAECVARVANRVGADMRRENCIAVVRLGARLADRLRCDINLDTEALLRLGSVIFGFYMGAEEYLKSVDVQAPKELSRSLAQDELSRLLANGRPHPRIKQYLGSGRVGNSYTSIFHHPDCYRARQIKINKAIWFESSDEATAGGYKPCGVCKPQVPYTVLNIGRQAYLTDGSSKIADSHLKSDL